MRDSCSTIRLEPSKDRGRLRPFTKRMSDKNFRKHPKEANLSVLSPDFSSCIIYALFVEIPRYLEVPVIDFCETLHKK